MSQDVTLTLHVNIPAERVQEFADALTGMDDDIVLAAEHAMRNRIGWAPPAAEDIEISFPRSEVFEALRKTDES